MHNDIWLMNAHRCDIAEFRIPVRVGSAVMSFTWTRWKATDIDFGA
jgi:hypothetical protein